MGVIHNYVSRLRVVSCCCCTQQPRLLLPWWSVYVTSVSGQLADYVVHVIVYVYHITVVVVPVVVVGHRLQFGPLATARLLLSEIDHLFASSIVGRRL